MRRRLDQRAFDVAVCDHLSMAVATRTGYEGQEWGTWYDGRASEDVRGFLLFSGSWLVRSRARLGIDSWIVTYRGMFSLVMG